MSSNFVLLFQYCFGCLGLLAVLCELRISFFISAKKAVGILKGVVLNLEIALGTIAILTVLSLLSREHRMSFHLFRYSFVSVAEF